MYDEFGEGGLGFAPVQDENRTPTRSLGGDRKGQRHNLGAPQTQISASPVESYVPRQFRHTDNLGPVSWRDRDERFARMVRVMDPFQAVDRAEDTGEHDERATDPRIPVPEPRPTQGPASA